MAKRERQKRDGQAPNKKAGEADRARAPAEVAAAPGTTEPDPFAPSESFENILDTVSKEGLSPRPETAAVEPREPLERAVRVPLEVYVRVERGDRVARALTRDISASGVYLAALTLPIAAPGDQVMVEIGLPGVQESVCATARVARTPSGAAFPALGLAFENLTEADRTAIQDYVDSRARFVDDE